MGDYKKRASNNGRFVVPPQSPKAQIGAAPVVGLASIFAAIKSQGGPKSGATPDSGRSEWTTGRVNDRPKRLHEQYKMGPKDGQAAPKPKAKPAAPKR